MPWELGAISVFSIVALASATAAQGVTAVVPVSAFGTAGMLVGAVQLMKLANRRAQRRIANGDYPDIVSVHSSEPPGEEMVEGPAAQDGVARAMSLREKPH